METDGKGREAGAAAKALLAKKEGVTRLRGKWHRWHDIPVAVTLEPGGDYNIEIGFDQMNQWAYWLDTGGMPYAPHGLFEVYASSRNGDPSSQKLIHMRVNAANTAATSVEAWPGQPPPFRLEAPYPNPVSEVATMGYDIATAGPVTISVYNVAGRRVVVLLDSIEKTAGAGLVELDTRELAAGVYFVKMGMGARSVSRKITIVR